MNRLKQCALALKTVMGEVTNVGLHEPSFIGHEWEYVKSCIDSGWVSSVGKYVDRFEKELSQFTGIPYVVATVNGTAALHVCLILADVKPNDEVLVPAITFVATANAVTYCGAVPHFIDSELDTLGIDIEKLSNYLSDNSYIKENVCINKKSGRAIRAVIPVHIFGHPVDMDALQRLADHYHLKIIEDASESLGSYYKSKHTGALGMLGCLSFNGNKIITTGGGGAILTQDKNLALRAKHLTTQRNQRTRGVFITMR